MSLFSTRSLLAFGCALLLSAAPVVAQRPYHGDNNNNGNNNWAYPNGNPGRWDQSWNNRPNPRAGVCFFTDRNFRGNPVLRARERPFEQSPRQLRRQHLLDADLRPRPGAGV